MEKGEFKNFNNALEKYNFSDYTKCLINCTMKNLTTYLHFFQLTS